jgi:selenocysteine lyase/cysteine desulfurase|tara:strand:+ start:1045 stop:2310 length:1266 start_codon:yes stop_codon:yes gene_type:complete
MNPDSQAPKDCAFPRRKFLGNLAAAGIAGISSNACLAPESPPIRATMQLGSESIRQQFVLPDNLIYLNCGSLGPCPQTVIEATNDAWTILESNPVNQAYGPLLLKMEKVRQNAADFLGCDLAELAFTRNATEAMSTIAQGIQLKPGQRILTSDQEHPGGSICWEYFAKRTGIHIDKVKLGLPPSNADEILRVIKAAISPQTRVISLSHVTYPTGIRMPLRQIAGLARTREILLIVDGAQAPGMLPVNLHDLDCDAYAASAHKWMMAPKGTGLLYIHHRARKQIQPLLLHSGPAAYTVATGTRDVPAIIGLGTALNFLKIIGAGTIERYAMQLRQRLYRGLQAIDHVRVVSPAPGPLASPMLSFSLRDFQPNAVTEALQKKSNIVIKVASSPGFHGLRISPHLYNTSREIDLLLAQLKEIVN